MRIRQQGTLYISFIKLNKGLNTNGNPLNINNEESSSLQNVDFDRVGAFIKRNGYINLNTVAIT